LRKKLQLQTSSRTEKFSSNFYAFSIILNWICRRGKVRGKNSIKNSTIRVKSPFIIAKIQQERTFFSIYISERRIFTFVFTFSLLEQCAKGKTCVMRAKPDESVK
jgi:hypothetical protein